MTDKNSRLKAWKQPQITGASEMKHAQSGKELVLPIEDSTNVPTSGPVS